MFNGYVVLKPITLHTSVWRTLHFWLAAIFVSLSHEARVALFEADKNVGRH
jgi:hypothetical protein